MTTRPSLIVYMCTAISAAHTPKQSNYSFLVLPGKRSLVRQAFNAQLGRGSTRRMEGAPARGFRSRLYDRGKHGASVLGDLR